MSEHKTETDRWDVDPDEWPHTPPLDVWRRLYEDDDNLVWRAGIGHVVNALDAAIERVEAIEALLDRTEREARENNHLSRLSTRQVREALSTPPG